MIQSQRIQSLNHRGVARRAYVLYWMQASQRAEYNHALEYAIGRANELGVPVIVYFGLTPDFPEANARHYRFMLEGLNEVQSALKDRGIGMVIRRESPQNGVIALARDACLVVVDRGYLRIQRAWRRFAAERMDCPLMQVESDVIVPVETASSKEGYSAATFRSRVKRTIGEFLIPLPPRSPRLGSLGLGMDSLDIRDVKGILTDLQVDESVAPSPQFTGGARRARERLVRFLETGLDRYEDFRNDPNAEATSNLSPYLHFGQISPLEIALRVLEHGGPAVDAFLEELIVRRELSINYVFYNPDYDTFDALPAWARKTLSDHRGDPRPYAYALEELEGGRTHDPFWNAAQKEMTITGKMHGYMRMYWGKKILEWSASPEEAFRTALYLNNKYELDGRDPNGFAGVAWCFGKHDRPWGERPVFGSVRYMNENGLRRKFDAEAYVRKVQHLEDGRS